MEKEITQFTQDIWESILGLQAEPTNIFKAPELEKTLAGFIQIIGAWHGTVSIHCPASLARTAASIMFDVEEKKTTMEQIQDAIGELTNMLGGNIKSLLPEHESCHLSLPGVAITDHQLRIPGSTQVAKVTFKCQDHYFVVTLQKLKTSSSLKAENQGGN